MSAVRVRVPTIVEPLYVSIVIIELGSALPVIVGVVSFVIEDGVITKE